MAGIIGNTARGASQAKSEERKPLPLLTTSTASSSSAMCAENDENQPQEPSPPNHVENRKNHPKAALDDAEHVSIVEPSIARHPEERQLRNSTVFCAPQPGHLSLHNKRRMTTIPRTRSAAQCALCVPRSACSWNVHHSVDELKHTRVHEQRLLELMLHVHKDSTRRPVFLSRPGLAVEPHKLSASSSPHCSRIVDATLHTH